MNTSPSHPFFRHTPLLFAVAWTGLRALTLVLATCGLSLATVRNVAGENANGAQASPGHVSGMSTARTGEFSIIHNGENYRVNILYPGIGNSIANTEISIWAFNRAASFIRGVENIAGPAPLPYTLHIDYEVEHCSDHTTSVIFVTSTVMGAAQPLRGLATFIYDLTTGRRLAYEDIFRSTEGLLPFLSRTARDTLADRLGPELNKDMLDAGTAPDRVNFALYSLASQELILHFPPGQVAPESQGYLRVSIPLHELSAFRPYLHLWGRSEQP